MQVLRSVQRSAKHRAERCSCSRVGHGPKVQFRMQMAVPAQVQLLVLIQELDQGQVLESGRNRIKSKDQNRAVHKRWNWITNFKSWVDHPRLSIPPKFESWVDHPRLSIPPKIFLSAANFKSWVDHPRLSIPPKFESWVDHPRLSIPPKIFLPAANHRRQVPAPVTPDKFTANKPIHATHIKQRQTNPKPHSHFCSACSTMKNHQVRRHGSCRQHSHSTFADKTGIKTNRRPAWSQACTTHSQGTSNLQSATNTGHIPSSTTINHVTPDKCTANKHIHATHIKQRQTNPKPHSHFCSACSTMKNHQVRRHGSCRQHSHSTFADKTGIKTNRRPAWSQACTTHSQGTSNLQSATNTGHIPSSTTINHVAHAAPSPTSTPIQLQFVSIPKQKHHKGQQTSVIHIRFRI